MSTDFSSLDKLVEFGLGLGIATQMMNTMNSVISNTAIPGVGINPGVIQPEKVGAPRPVVEKVYYIVKDEYVAGPLNENDLAELVRKGSLTKTTFCWSPGMTAWVFAEAIPEVNKVLLLNS